MGSVRVPLYFPVESRDLAAFSGGTPQKDQKLVNCLQETIGDQKWIVKRPGLKPYGSIGANALIDLAILESSNTQTFVPVTHTYTTAGAANEAIPANASFLTIRAWGAGASGGRGKALPDPGVYGGGAGGGAGSKKSSIAIAAGDWGQNIAYVVGAKGAGVSTVSTDGNNGGDTTVTSSGLSFTNLNINAGGGRAGKGTGDLGAGGTASGGDTNVSGSDGTDGFGDPSFGGNSATVDGINGAGGNPGANPGGGGNGVQNGTSKAGADGRVDFIWT